MTQRRKVGRPRVITKDIEARLIQAAGTGQHLGRIASACGISARTLNRYLQLAEKALEKHDRGRRLTKAEKELCQFCRAFQEAEAGPENVALGIVTKGLEDARKAMQDPNSKPAARAAAVDDAYRFLEHRYPQRWGRRTVVANESAVDGTDGPGRRPLRVSLTDCPPDVLEREAAKRGIAGLLTVPPAPED